MLLAILAKYVKDDVCHRKPLGVSCEWSTEQQVESFWGCSCTFLGGKKSFTLNYCLG